MKRMVDLKEISDGRIYSSGDMVRADCHDCTGCSDCCRGMGSSIILDPMDNWKIRLGIPNLKAYENYILKWHDFLNDCEEALPGLDDKNARILTLYVLRCFYENRWTAADENAFYEEFSERLKEVREKLGI